MKILVTGALAEQAAVAGVKHFVFLSSCHAVAAESEMQITEKTQPNPVAAYGALEVGGRARDSGNSVEYCLCLDYAVPAACLWEGQ